MCDSLDYTVTQLELLRHHVFINVHEVGLDVIIATILQETPG